MAPKPKITIEAVVLGARITAEYEGTSATDAIADLKRQDPDAKFHADLKTYSKGGGFGGKRDTKAAACAFIQVRGTKSGAFVDLTCTGDEAVTVSVSKKKLDTLAADLAALGCVGDANLELVRQALDTKKSATIMLEGAERFTVNYWTTDDGQHFAESYEKGNA